MNKDNHMYFSTLIREFHTEINIEKAIVELMNKLCVEYRFNKITSFLNEKASEEFLWLHTYTSNEDKTEYRNNYNEETDVAIDNYPLRMTRKNVERENKLYDLFDNTNVIYTRDVKSISEQLDILDFEHEKYKDVKALLIYALIDEQDILGYCVFEKYDEEYITEDDFESLKMFFYTINIIISSNEKFKEVHKRFEINKALLNTIQIDSYSAVLEKNTLSILYYENSQGVVFDDEEIKKKQLEVLSDLKFLNIKTGEFLENLNESIYSKRHDGDYVTRLGLINWQSENDAFIISTMNVTKAFKNKLIYDNLTDSLTWLGFKESIKKTYSINQKYAYISLNLEGMKLINDIHTQVVGNEILKQLAIVIKKFIHKDEYFCRVVADNYGIVIKYTNTTNLEKRVKQLNTLVSKMCRNIFSELILVITGGIYIVQGDLYKNIDLAFENTGLARDTAKGSYKNTFVLYDESMREKLKINKHIESKIETAIVNDEFTAYLQPKFRIDNGKVIGAEALVRWHTSEEIIAPDKFIPVFESDGFISVLDFIMYEKIFVFIKKSLDEGLEVVPISINASRNHLSDEHFLEKLLGLFKQFNVPKELIEIEITENASEGSDEDLKEFVKRLKQADIAVSMDDFGSAYSSLNLLKTLELDTLKLDKAFLGKVEKEKCTDSLSRDEIIIKNVVNMGNELGFKVLCEGVETQEQADFLRSIGCEYGQGFILSKPVPLDEFKERFLRSLN